MYGLVWGHRGCRGPGNPPENSLASFRAALDCGAGGIEFDVQLSKDDAPVVFHDNTLERMTGAAGQLSAITFADLRKLRLLNNDGRPSREAIPTLGAVLRLVNQRRSVRPFVVNIELKDPKSAEVVAMAVLERLGAGWKLENFLVSSFDMDCLRRIKTLIPGLLIGTLFDCSADELAGQAELAADLKAATVNVPFASLTPAALRLIEAAGATAVVWTPNETSPCQLSQSERERLTGRLQSGRVVAITDFPKELLNLLKPNRARATATGMLAACLSYREQVLLFRPSEPGLETLKSPSEYPELKPFAFTASQLTARDGVRFTVWENKGSADRPHFLLFHGNRAHWGDTGPGDSQRDRHARLKFIEELAAAGAGVTAVTLRGFGNSGGKPGEQGFLLDISSVVEHVLTSGIDHRRLVIAGESLGTWAAMQAAVIMTRQNRAPTLVSLQNPFTCMAELGEQVISHFPIVRSFNIGLSASALDRHVLKIHFYSASLIGELSANTAIHIATSGKDDLVHPSHSGKLADMAAILSRCVIRDLYPEALHENIPPVEFARRLMALGVELCQEVQPAASEPVIESVPARAIGRLTPTEAAKYDYRFAV